MLVGVNLSDGVLSSCNVPHEPPVERGKALDNVVKLVLGRLKKKFGGIIVNERSSFLFIVNICRSGLEVKDREFTKIVVRM